MWPDDAFSLPARDGYDVGGAQERAMSARVDGYGGIRETYEVNSDGSVTTLRTRMGWPAFETTGQPTAAAAPTVPARGFVAKVPGGRAVLFNPYTLAVLKSPYLPSSNSYSVQDFGTTWNVAPADTTHWYDVVLFDGTTIKVNSKAMPSLRITANHGFPAIPYVINRADASDQYGNAERNTTEKRVFAVGRFSVKSWGGGGIVETLTPTTPRTDTKAMTIGQRADRSTSTAWLAQMFYSGYTWYDNGGEWGFSTAQVQMLLTAPYLIKTSSGYSAALPIATFGGPVNTTTNTTQAITLPSTPVGITGPGEIQENDSYPPFALIRGGFRTNGTIWHEYPGRIEATNNKTQYTGTSVDTRMISGYALTYSGSNTKTFLTSNEGTYCDGGERPLAPADSYGPANDHLRSTGTTLFWDSGYTASTVPTHRGPTTRTITDFFIDGSACTRYYEHQQGDFQVSCNSVEIVRVTLSKDKQYGPKALLTPNSTYYDTWMGTLWIGGFGMGTYAEGYYYVSNSDVSGYKTTYPEPKSPEVVAEVNAAFQEMGHAWYGQTMVTDETRSGTTRTNFWYASTPNYTLTTGTLSWSTVDYLLHDATNGVFITVEASFSGVDALATLTVLLRVKTRHHSNTQTLGVFSYNYGSADGMLHEVEIGVGTSKYAVPSPQIRAIFAPLYQEQGSFKGAHYVTLAEESNGATPFHGFNFLLHLRTYDGFSTCNTDNETQYVYFVPCNLLEMLYAFVFSTEYGVSAYGDRYPVTYTARYTEMVSTLFSNPISVAVKNGAAGAWTDALGADFASVSTVSLHRA